MNLGFIGKDIATVLGYKNPNDALQKHVDSEDKRMEMIAHSQNGNVVTQTPLINESGLYSLVLSPKVAKKLNDKTSSSFGQVKKLLVLKWKSHFRHKCRKRKFPTSWENKKIKEYTEVII